MPLKIFITLFIITVLHFTSKGELMSSFTSSDNKIQVLNRKSIKNSTPSRPEAPELQCVTCFNDDGLFIIEFAAPEGECYIYIETWEGGTFDQFFDSNALVTSIYVGSFQQADITITTEWGNEYYGTIFGQ